MSTLNAAEAVETVKSKLAEMRAGDDTNVIGLEELADECGATEVATEILRTSRWYEQVLHVLAMANGIHVGVIKQEGLTENQEDPGADTWEVVAVESRERVVTKWSVVR